MEELEQELKREEELLQDHLDSYENAKQNNDKRFEEIYLTIINEDKKRVNNIKLKMDVELIKPYLKEKGVHVNLFKTLDYGSFKLTKLNDKRVLEYAIRYFDSSGRGSDCIKMQHGIVVYDDKGNVLLDNIKLHYDNELVLSIGKKCHELYESGEPSDIFIDEENMLLHVNNEDGERTYAHYKLISGVYQKAHEFTSKDWLFGPVWNIPRDNKFTQLKTNNDSKLAFNYGRLYSIDEGKYLTNLTFDNILDKDYDISKTPRLGCRNDDIYNRLSKKLNNSNLLVGTFTMTLNTFDYVNTMVFLDYSGNIVSNVIYCVEFDSDRDLHGVNLPMVMQKEVTNETYMEVLYKIKEESVNYVKDVIEEKKKAEIEENKRRNEAYKKRLEAIAESLDFDKEKETTNNNRIRRPIRNPRV